MKLAFIHQPIGDAIDPGRHSGSLTIFLYEIARRLAASSEVIIYTRRLPSQLEIEQVDGIQYRRLVPFYDDCLLRRVNWFADFRSRNRPMFASHWFHHGYIRRIAKDLPGQHCDFAFVQTLPQYPAVSRDFNPELRIALNMQCEWLNQLDRSMISRHLQAVDLVLGCSKYITEKVQAAFPEYSGRCRTLLNGCDIDRFPVGAATSLVPGASFLWPECLPKRECTFCWMRFAASLSTTQNCSWILLGLSRYPIVLLSWT